MKPWHEDVRRYFTEHLIYDESSDSLCWSDGGVSHDKYRRLRQQNI